MLRSEVCDILRKHLPVLFLSENKAEWIALENVKDQYVPVHYGYKNIIYQSKYFEAVYDTYTDISVVIFGGGNSSLCMAFSLLEKRWGICYWQ